MKKDLRKLWDIELGIFKEFEKICKKHHLQYWAMGGTLLGAVRHQGFIPWDDDMDLIMPRVDYEKFLEIAPKELPEPYFLSTPMTEHRFYRTHAQIRNSNTTGFIKNDLKFDNNKGVFIDVFVLDKVPETLEERQAFGQELIKCNDPMTFYNHYMIHPELMTGIKGIAKRFILRTTSDAKCKQVFQKFNATCAKFQHTNTKKVGHLSIRYREGTTWDADDFRKTIRLPFEDVKINAPIGYKHVLSCQYGDDYMEIPKNPPRTFHGEITFDPDTPYDEYIRAHHLK